MAGDVGVWEIEKRQRLIRLGSAHRGVDCAAAVLVRERGRGTADGSIERAGHCQDRIAQRLGIQAIVHIGAPVEPILRVLLKVGG